MTDTFGKPGTSEKATGVASGSVVVAATVSDKVVVRKYDLLGQTWLLLWTTTVGEGSVVLIYSAGISEWVVLAGQL